MSRIWSYIVHIWSSYTYTLINETVIYINHIWKSYMISYVSYHVVSHIWSYVDHIWSSYVLYIDKWNYNTYESYNMEIIYDFICDQSYGYTHMIMCCRSYMIIIHIYINKWNCNTCKSCMYKQGYVNMIVYEIIYDLSYVCGYMNIIYEIIYDQTCVCFKFKNIF